MKISKKLHQFEDQKTLILVLAKQGGECFLAKDGTIVKVASFAFRKPRYTDREGHFKTRAHGKVIRSGAVYEPQKEWIIEELIRELTATLRRVTAQHNAIDALYVFTPPYLVNRVTEAIPARFRKILHVLRGSYVGKHPFEIIQHINA